VHLEVKKDRENKIISTSRSPDIKAQGVTTEEGMGGDVVISKLTEFLVPLVLTKQSTVGGCFFTKRRISFKKEFENP